MMNWLSVCVLILSLGVYSAQIFDNLHNQFSSNLIEKTHLDYVFAVRRSVDAPCRRVPRAGIERSFH